MDEKKNYLGVDWGSSNIGVALAHGETRVALAYATLANDARLLQRLGDIIAKENIGTVVIGLPHFVGHEAGEYEGEKLGRLIGKQCAVAIAYQNEMFTTKMAQANLLERGEKDVSKHNDEEAARIILQEWLDIGQEPSLSGQA